MSNIPVTSSIHNNMLVYTRPGIEKITHEGKEHVDFIHIPRYYIYTT